MVCDVSVERPRVSIVSVEDILNQVRTYLFLGFSVYNHNYVQAFVNKNYGKQNRDVNNSPRYRSNLLSQ